MNWTVCEINTNITYILYLNNDTELFVEAMSRFNEQEKTGFIKK
jgi:hypothetical protein